jgi:hypothetical protein
MERIKLMANYTITNEWQSLSTILGEAYDATKQYRIHNNISYPGKLCLTEEETVTNQTIGRVYPELCEIYTPAGNNPYLRVIHSLVTGYNVEISEVE